MMPLDSDDEDFMPPLRTVPVVPGDLPPAIKPQPSAQ